MCKSIYLVRRHPTLTSELFHERLKAHSALTGMTQRIPGRQGSSGRRAYCKWWAPTLSRQAFEVLEQLVDGIGLTDDVGQADRMAQQYCDIQDLAALHAQVADAAIR